MSGIPWKGSEVMGTERESSFLRILAILSFAKRRKSSSVNSRNIARQFQLVFLPNDSSFTPINNLAEVQSVSLLQ